jgi:PAS domain S-box-containing protein
LEIALTETNDCIHYEQRIFDLELQIKTLKKEILLKDQAFKGLFSNLPGMVYRANPDWSAKIISNSQALCGYSIEDFNLKKVNWIEIIHPDDKELVFEETKGLLEEKISMVQEYRIVAKDGTIRWVRDHKTNCFTKDGIFDGIDGIVFDITKGIELQTSFKESEKKYRLLLQKANDAIYVHEINPHGPGRFLEVNDKACHLLGYTKAEFLKMGILDIAVPEQLKKIPLIIKQLHQSGQAIFFTENLTKDGRRIPVEVSASIFDYGSIPSVLAIVRDISTRKAAENEIIRSRDTQKVINALLRASVTEQPVEWILKNCLDLILSIQWLTVEPKGCIFLVEDRKDILIRKVQKGLDKELEAKCAEIPFGKCICGRAALSAKVEFSAKIDERHDIYIEGGMDDHGHYCIPILSESETLGVINIYLEAGHSYDETEVEFLSAVANTLAGIIMRRYAEKEKQQIEMEMHHAQQLESIGTLAGGIAHDFNNILFPIMGHTELLLMDTPEDSPSIGNLKAINTAALRAKDLVKQILAFARQESTEFILMKIQPLVKEALKLIRATIPTTIDIKLDINPDCGAIKGDPTKIHQIVMNLSTNAYHAMEYAGGELRVSLKEIEIDKQDVLSQDMEPGGYACLIIADTGIGMSKQLIEKIFDPFFTTKEKGKGTGMGLSVVHGIVKGMGGTIQVNSELGKGSEFNVYFPIVKSLSEERIIQSKAKIQGGTERILLVDDEEPIITMEKQLLEHLGYKVTSRTSSLEALEAFRANPDRFDLVITDMAMPNMPGDKLAIELIKIRPDIPIFLCTGFSENMSEEKAASLGIKGFLFKPIIMKDLAQKVREVLDGN